ncbi:MAG: diguanylate cyclase [Roseburia sp.]|nr:diguanylate cyclase [Roseburia sp.]
MLFISSYSYSWETVPLQIEGIKEAFGDDVVIDYKFMDTKNVNSQESMDLFYESMRQYMSEVKPYDGVIVGDDAAFQFVLDHEEELFSDLFIAFEGVNNVNLAMEVSRDDPLISGVVEELSYVNTIELARSLYPNATRLVAILDDSITADSERKAFFSLAADYQELEFSEINASEYSKKEFGEKLGEIEKDSILFYIMCSNDKDGNAYTSKEAVSWVSSNANVPTFAIVSIGMGYGMFGGEIISQSQMGYIAATMLKEEFENRDGKLPDVVRSSPREYCFDENMMRRFNIKQSDLPKGSHIVNHQVSFWERNRVPIVITVLIMATLVVIVIRLMVDNRKKNRINRNLQIEKDTFETAAKTDRLTGLKNRAVFYKELQRKIDDKEPFGLILFDVDGFKNINDTLGHNNGDVVLRELARRCSDMENAVFQMYRLAGDEFTAIVDGASEELAKNYARMIKVTFKDPFILEEKEYTLHSSIGVAMFPEDADNVKDIVDASDSAMYYVKKHGKNNIALYREIAVKSS